MAPLALPLVLLSIEFLGALRLSSSRTLSSSGSRAWWVEGVRGPSFELTVALAGPELPLVASKLIDVLMASGVPA
jgi:hypothetical protein